MSKEKAVLNDEDLGKVSGGDLGAAQLLLLAMLVSECWKEGMTRQEFLDLFEEKFGNKRDSDYYEMLGYAYSMWNDFEKAEQQNAQ